MTAQWHILGPELRETRVARGESLRAAAAATGLSPSSLSVAERGGPVVGEATIVRLAAHYAVTPCVRDRWLALAGHVPADIVDAILAQPEKWPLLRRVLQFDGADITAADALDFKRRADIAEAMVRRLAQKVMS